MRRTSKQSESPPPGTGKPIRALSCGRQVVVGGKTVPRKFLHFIIPAGALAAIAILFVGWDVVERHWFPTIPTGLRHLFLTVLAGMTTAIGCLTVYRIMRHQQRRLSETAGRLARLLESYMDDRNSNERFENPHLMHCREVLGCDNADCSMYESAGERCWQVMALKDRSHDQASPRVEIEKCHECEVYHLSCPDTLTELGESFNNLMFLLKTEADRVERMRARMLEKEKMASIGQLASGIAHEVGNPLSSISSIVQMLKRSGLNGRTGEQLDLIETHIKRITGTVRQLVKLARPGAERWEMIDVGRALEETVLLISFDPRARNIKIDFEHPESLPMTYGIPGQLQQVFINLFINALDAMQEGGTLTIRARKARESIIVDIKDTGTGIPQETGRRVFDPFYTTKDPGCGTGLGLAVSYGIVQKLRGTIDYDSKPGMGTVFTVCIPVLKESPEVHHGTVHHTAGR